MSLLLWRKLHHGSSAGAADAYAVGGNSPEFVADFAGVLNSGTEYYRSGGSDTTFSSVFTHSGLVLPATMTDSDGVLKWAPHNLILQSENFSTTWVPTNVTVTSNATTAPDGTSTADLLDQDSVSNTVVHAPQALTIIAGVQYTFCVYLKQNNCTDYVKILLGSGNQTAGFGIQVDPENNFTSQYANAVGTGYNYVSSSVTSVGSGWYRVSVTGSSDTTTSVATYIAFNSLSTGAHNVDRLTNGGTGGVYVWGAHIYRSDLGGMVNNPDRGDSYVPTTTAALFLPRRNHYIYNGSTYDNAGILIEPAAATNLVTQSRDLSTTWIISAANRVALNGTVTGPDGVSGSAQVVEMGSDASASTRGYAFTLTATVDTYCNSFILKDPGTGPGWVALVTQDATDGLRYSYFDLRNGVKGTANANHVANMENLGGGWYRCSVRNTYASTTTQRIWIIAAYADNASSFNQDTGGFGTTPTGTDLFYFYHAQTELGSVPTSPIITAGSTVTRAAETAPTDDLEYDATSMWFHQQGRVSYADLNTVGQITLFDWRADSNNRITVTLDTDGAETGEITLTMVSGGTSWSVAADYLSPGVNVAYNIAWRCTSSEINLAVGGTAATANTSPTSIPDLSSSSATFGGQIMTLLRQGSGDIGDSGLESATS